MIVESIPVPPGTGVIFPAILQQSSTSTLPLISSISQKLQRHIPLVAVEAYVGPISITVQSGFSQSPLILLVVLCVDIT